MDIFETQAGRGAFPTQLEKRTPQTRMSNLLEKWLFIIWSIPFPLKEFKKKRALASRLEIMVLKIKTYNYFSIDGGKQKWLKPSFPPR